MEAAARIIELDVKATKGPWVKDYGGTYGHIKSTAGGFPLGGTPTLARYDKESTAPTVRDQLACNGDLIAEYRTLAPAVARELIELRKAAGISESDCVVSGDIDGSMILDGPAGNRRRIWPVAKAHIEEHHATMIAENANLRERCRRLEAAIAESLASQRHCFGVGDLCPHDAGLISRSIRTLEEVSSGADPAGPSGKVQS
jgi:hypothetical protein